MIAVIRCPGCHRLLTVPSGSVNILCPVCGLTFPKNDAIVYVTCRDDAVAEDIVRQLSTIIHNRNGKDLTAPELAMLRERYAAWARQQEWT